MKVKNKMFNKWYEEEGREFVKQTFPVEDDLIDEKNIRKRAKKMYMKIINDFKAETSMPKIREVNDITTLFKKRKMDLKNSLFKLNEEKQDLIAFMTDLYDTHNKKEMSDEYFNRTKRYYAEQLESIKAKISATESCIRNDKKVIQFLNFFTK